ncbi:MAG: 3-deoxy-D-manno-octulosonic acid transferase [Desulfobulbales bacterium]|nr:3-deoxy-D-manno-octulosonic acid transferase [Desulfobulbales bacterium]
MEKVYQAFMLIIYNLMQIILAVLLLPVLLPVVLLTPKYRTNTGLRLGFGLAGLVRDLGKGGPRIWVHALSVGEVSSAGALVGSLRRQYPDGILIFSTSTGSGRAYAAATVAGQVDLLVPFPLDLLWSVERFIRLLRPEVFVLVETDLWPNFLASLKRHGVAALLVNGRVSAESFRKYRAFRCFFGPMFKTFGYIAMQTEADLEKMQQLGMPAARLLKLGNLKYEVPAGAAAPEEKAGPESADPARNARRLWVAGSTHRGEEEVILRVYRKLRADFNDLQLVIAPRKIERGAEVAALADDLGLESSRRSAGGKFGGELLILDTLGELAALYKEADFAFIGGSLVRERGHNPLEPALFGRPVVFGPHMEDFAEIAADLLAVGGAVRVDDEHGLAAILRQWLSNDEERRTAGERAARLIGEHRGVTDRHVELIGRVIDRGFAR